jgi:hypothetical protein
MFHAQMLLDHPDDFGNFQSLTEIHPPTHSCIFEPLDLFTRRRNDFRCPIFGVLNKRLYKEGIDSIWCSVKGGVGGEYRYTFC